MNKLVLLVNCDAERFVDCQGKKRENVTYIILNLLILNSLQFLSLLSSHLLAHSKHV